MEFVPGDIADASGFVDLKAGERLDVWAEITNATEDGDRMRLDCAVLWPADRVGQTFRESVKANPRGKLVMYRLGVLAKDELTSTTRRTVTPEDFRGIQAWAYLVGKPDDTNPARVYANPIFDGWSVEKPPPKEWTGPVSPKGLPDDFVDAQGRPKF